MKRNQFFNRVLCLMGVALMASLTLVSCNKKDDVNPDDNTDTTPVVPTPTSNFVVGSDTATISVGMLVKYEGIYQMGFTCKNGTTIVLVTMGQPAAGTYSFGDLMSVYYGQAGYYGFYYTDDDGDDPIELDNGTITITSINENNLNLSFQGKGTDSVAVSLTYNGTFIDMTKPMGTGSFVINGETFAFDRGAGMSQGGMYEYDFMDGDWENSINITSIEQLKSGKTYTIVSDETETLLADQVTLQYCVGDGDEGTYENSATSGTLQCSISGETYTLTISGTSADGNFTCTYTGKLPLFSSSKKGNTSLLPAKGQRLKLNR